MKELKTCFINIENKIIDKLFPSEDNEYVNDKIEINPETGRAYPRIKYAKEPYDDELDNELYVLGYDPIKLSVELETIKKNHQDWSSTKICKSIDKSKYIFGVSDTKQPDEYLNVELIKSLFIDNKIVFTTDIDRCYDILIDLLETSNDITNLCNNVYYHSDGIEIVKQVKNIFIKKYIFENKNNYPNETNIKFEE